MIVDSKNMEFGYELLTAVPYAYMMHLSGNLESTRSGRWSEPLYYFSPEHKINPQERAWNGVKAATIPDSWRDIHKPEIEDRIFPPYKQQYKNSEYKWEKPTLVIANRANIEWRHSVINYFDAEILDWMFSSLSDKYEIVYLPVSIPKDIQDGVSPVDVGDIPVAKKHGVKMLPDLIKTSWNDTLLKVFANCDHYITMNGGYSILASYFSGTNIIYSKPGTVQTKELNCNAFYRWYPNISGVRTLHVPSYDDLKEKVTELYIKDNECVNVIIRTSARPIGFERAINSVLAQSYPNINIVVTCDESNGVKYTRKFPCRMVKVTPPEKTKKPAGQEYGQWFPANDYLNQIKGLKGYIYILDDDNYLSDPDSIGDMVAQSTRGSLTVARANICGRVMPCADVVQLYDIDSLCMMYHTDAGVRWEPWKRGDFRVANSFKNHTFLDRVVAQSHSVQGYGRKKDITKTFKVMKTDKLTIQFLRPFKDFGINQIVEVPWIEGMYYLRRGVAVEYEKAEDPRDVEVTEPTPPQDKEHKPKRRRKTRKQ